MATPKTQTITVDLDSFDLATEQGFGSGVGLVRFDILQDNKRVTVSVDLFQHELRPNPTIRMTVINKSKDVVKTAQVKPWVRDFDANR